MSHKTEIVTAISTLGCAIGIGFVMQSGDLAELRYGSGQLGAMSTTPLVGQPAVPVLVNDVLGVSTSGLLDVQGITLTSAKINMPPKASVDGKVFVSATTDDIDDLKSSETSRDPHSKEKRHCEPVASAQPTAAAMVTLSVDAPCFANTPVTIRHEGLTFSEMMDDAGTLEVLVPALAEKARIKTTFENGESIGVFAYVDSIALYDRVVVQWQGETGVQIHAREFGADYGTEGHVWVGAPRDFSAVAGGRGGFLTALGRADIAMPSLAEVYTFPTALSTAKGDVALTVETEVTDANCGTEVRARAYEFAAGKEVSSQILSLAVPNCSAVGNFLVLNNLLQDLTVASK